MAAECMTADEFNRRTKENNWKWVKLTNEEECHNGFKFQTGMNVDSKPFIPETDCGHGIYFCREEDIHIWAGGHAYVRDVIIPPSATELVTINHNRYKAKAHQILLGDRRHLWNDTFCKIVLPPGLFALDDIPKDQRTYDICKLAVQHNGHDLEHVPQEKHNYEIYKLSVQQDGDALQHVPRDVRTEEICKIAVEKHGHTLEYVPQHMKTHEICKLAVQQNGYALEYVPQHMKTHEICKLAVQQNGYARHFVPQHLRTDVICKLVSPKYSINPPMD